MMKAETTPRSVRGGMGQSARVHSGHGHFTAVTRNYHTQPNLISILLNNDQKGSYRKKHKT